MKRPVFWLGLCYLAGETLGLAITPDYAWVIALMTFIVITMMLLIFTGRRSDKLRHKSKWLLVLPVFWLIGYLRLSNAMCDAIETDIVLESMSETYFQGKVISVEEKEHCFYIYTKIEDNTFLTVVMTEDMLNCDLIAGNIIEISGRIECFSVSTNEGMFHERLYYHAGGIDGRIWADSVELVSDESFLTDRFMWQLKNYLTKNCQRYLSKKAAGVAISMLTGERGGLDTDIEELYRLSGIAHILAISGLHISFVGMGLYRTLRCLRVRPQVCAIVGVCVLILYGIFTGMAPSTVRAVIMTGLQVIAKGWGYTYDRKSAYGAAIIVVLFYRPLMITQPGFTLSFGAVGCLIFSERFLPKYLKHAERILKWQNKILNTLIPSFAVTLGMMPLTAFHFYMIPLYGMFLNLLVIPLMSILYPAVLLGGFLGGIFGEFLRPVFVCIERILEFYEIMCTWSLKLPGSIVTCGKPGVGTIVLIYGGMVFLCGFVQRLRVALTLKRFAVVGGCMLVLLLFFNKWTPNFRITMLDVGQGDCFIISLPSGKHILVDGGSSDVKSVGEYRLIPFLKSQGIDTLDAVFLSHLDYDHTSAVWELLALEEDGDELGAIHIEQLIVPVLSKKNESREKLSELVKLAPGRCYMAGAGNTLTFSDLKIRVLWPNTSDISGDSNEGSLVLFMEYQGVGVLFTGDVGIDAEKVILEDMKPSQCHVLKVAHHGSKYSSSLEFLQELSPKVALISAGEGNSYGHPHKELLERLDILNTSVYLTSHCGQITLYKSQKDIKVVVWKENDVYNRYIKALSLKEKYR